MTTVAWRGWMAAACAWLPAVGVLTGAALGQTAPVPASDVQVWSSDIHDSEYGAAAGGAPAIAITGARNGSFSGKVMAGSGAPLRSLRAVVSDLKGEGSGAIPAAAIAIRYAVPWDGGIAQGWGSIKGPDILLESPPAEFPAAAGGRATAVIWVTVHVPKDTAPGIYAGRLTVEAEGSGPSVVPIRLEVKGWTLPDAQDYRVWAEVIQQPDTLAAEYDLPRWSEKHWEMIARSLRLIRPTGSRVVYVPLICRTNFGNEETMVRWIRRPDGRYDHDFTVMERYLDLVQKELGTPAIVAFNVWEVYLSAPRQADSSPVEVKGNEGSYEWRESSFARALQKRMGKGPFVTVLDPAAKTTEQFVLPRYEDPAAKALWKPVWDGVRSRMKARGLEQAMMLAQVSDRRPVKEEVAFWNDLTGGIPWISCTHNPLWPADSKESKGQLSGIGTVAYAAVALEYFFNIEPAKGRYYGWQLPLLRAQYWRFGYFNTNPLSTIRHEAEANITGRQRGVGHIGGDFWPCFRNRGGRRSGTVTDRYPESYWHSLNVGSWLLAPGPDGPVGTARLEVFREGLQECEARIAIESALTDPARAAKLGADLARRAQDALDERLRCLWKARGATDADFEKYGLVAYRTYSYEIAEAWKSTRGPGHQWFLSSGWAEQTGQLYALAAEVSAKLGP